MPRSFSSPWNFLTIHLRHRAIHLRHRARQHNLFAEAEVNNNMEAAAEILNQADVNNIPMEAAAEILNQAEGNKIPMEAAAALNQAEGNNIPMEAAAAEILNQAEINNVPMEAAPAEILNQPEVNNIPMEATEIFNQAHEILDLTQMMACQFQFAATEIAIYIHELNLPEIGNPALEAFNTSFNHLSVEIEEVKEGVLDARNRQLVPPVDMEGAITARDEALEAGAGILNITTLFYEMVYIAWVVLRGI